MHVDLPDATPSREGEVQVQTSALLFPGQWELAEAFS